MSTCADVGSFIDIKMSVVQTSNVVTSEVADYLGCIRALETGNDGDSRRGCLGNRKALFGIERQHFGECPVDS